MTWLPVYINLSDESYTKAQMVPLDRSGSIPCRTKSKNNPVRISQVMKRIDYFSGASQNFRFIQTWLSHGHEKNLKK